MNQVWQLQDTQIHFNDIIESAKKYGTQIIKQNQAEFVLLTMVDYQRLLQPIYQDLDALSGTWTEQQSNEFLSTLSDFSQIDEELWH
jgi:hypothetical protein